MKVKIHLKDGTILDGFFDKVRQAFDMGTLCYRNLDNKKLWIPRNNILYVEEV